MVPQKSSNLKGPAMFLEAVVDEMCLMYERFFYDTSGLFRAN